MTIQVLVSALEKDPEKLLEQMNIHSPAVMVNQCDKDEVKHFDHHIYPVVIISSRERGVGRSRNLCLDNATADIVLFSDDDIIYNEGYEETVLRAFRENPHADILLFNMEVRAERKTYWNTEKKKIGKMNCGRYPAYSIAARRDALARGNVRFSLLFGGGAKYSNGEDSLFLMDALRAGLNIYTVTDVLGREEATDSTWFHGYNKKFFYDRGVLFAFLYREQAGLWAFRFIYLKRNMEFGEMSKAEAYEYIRDGIREGRKLMAGTEKTE